MGMTWRKAAKISAMGAVVFLATRVGFDSWYARNVNVTEAILSAMVFCVAFGGIYWLLEKKGHA